ncbi:MAG: hypothetical protein HOI29_09760 [Planctomycetes bacterium]|jgi:hypothetical protein|nr:hypothetical protein [Planctomycetota bacterium]MBT6785361.1 hypothetical protein [Planctomycetota bacterium]MBT6968532.1 hypothetical protein [Planctomycetota bacterium]MBT7104472.1 hypothetical protein [Planctomycetota bacterium]
MSDFGVLRLDHDPATARLSLPSLLLFCVYCTIMIGPGATPVLAQETMIRISTITTEAGQPFILPIEGDWDGLLEGYSFSVAFPPNAPIENMIVDVYGSLVGSIEAEYVQEQVDPTEGTIICGVLFDALPPFDGQTVPSLGYPQEIAYLLGEISAGSLDQDIEFCPQDGFGTPPIMNMFVIGSSSVSVSALVSGIIEVRAPPVDPVFIRGDVNMDTLVDLADPIYHLDYTFLDGPLPNCMDAGDANDDGISDISDAIFLLYYFFIGGPGPWVPFPYPGIDWTDDSLDCEIGL